MNYNDEVLIKFPDSGQKIVCKVKNEKYGVCIKKNQKDITSVSKIKREIEMQSELNTEYYPKIYEFNFDNESCLIYEEYIDGENLENIISENNIYYKNEIECINFLEEMIKGLTYIWDKEIVHRDIKPSNIIIRNNKKPVILDLGIAKRLNSTYMTQGCMWGTLGYASPEQTTNRREIFGKKSDMFSLGAVIYEMFYGKKAFKSIEEVCIKECEFNLDGFNPSINFISILKKILQKQPYNRYKNSEMIFKDIKKFKEGDNNE